MKLKNIACASVIAVAASALLFSATTARADFNGGGPIKKGKMCWVATTGNDQGMWVACPKPAKAAKKAKKKAAKKK